MATIHRRHVHAKKQLKRTTLYYRREKWERIGLKYRSERIGKDKLYTTCTVRIIVASF